MEEKAKKIKLLPFEDLKKSLNEKDPTMAKVLVPNCIYRFGCPEFKPCGFFQRFIEFAEQNGQSIEQLSDIKVRYDLYSVLLHMPH